MRARLDGLARGATAGVFWGLLPGIGANVIAGTIALPFSALLFAAASAAAGALAGAAVGFLAGIDIRALLIRADRRLETRELVSTAWDLAVHHAEGVFPDAVTEDAVQLLGRETPRHLLGKLPLPFLPWAPALCALLALAVLFPVNIRSLFAGPRSRQAGELEMIGEDLRSYGQRLQDSAKKQNLPESLALSQELAQLGKDLADRSIQKDEALDRMSELERRLGEEYDLRLLSNADQLPGAQGKGTGKAGEGQGDGGGGNSSGADNGAGAASPADRELKDLGDALNKLRDAQRRALGGAPSDAQGSDSATAVPPSGGQGQGGGEAPAGNGSGSTGSRPQGGAPGSGPGAGGSHDAQPGSEDGAPPGTAPAPQKTGAPTSITEGDNKPSIRANAAPGEGDSTKLLVRSLPEWTGSKVPEGTVLQQYSKQVESALRRDEIPPKLKQYVKDYFTIIGMSAGDAAKQ